MRTSLCGLFHMQDHELTRILGEIIRAGGDDYERQRPMLDALISGRLGGERPDEVLLFHLSRRLNGTEDDMSGQNLADLLTTENSTYYCCEYKLPLDRVIFDGYDDLPRGRKQEHLIRCVLERLIDYQVSDPPYIHDHGNPILRLGDNDTVPGEMFVRKEPIPDDI